MALPDHVLLPHVKMLRSYVKGVGMYGPPGCVQHQSGAEFWLSWPIPVIGIYVETFVILKPEFFAWSSNAYSPDWLYADMGERYLSGLVIHYLPTPIFNHYDPVTNSPYLTDHVNYWFDFYYWSLPPSPTGYWLPPLP